MPVGRGAPHAVALGDGSVLVVGNDGFHRDNDPSWFYNRCVRDNSAIAELWDPSTKTWRATASLNNPRADFVAVPLYFGALVTGGVTPGSTDETGHQYGHQSYSSTYIYDPSNPGRWKRAALLGIARTDPIAAALPDGRVLVAGGYYLSGTTGRSDRGPASILAASRLAPLAGPTPPEVILADVGPDPGPTTLAKAELYDPATDRWSATGPMRYARHGAAAATLADGRVLVVGSSVPSWDQPWDDVRVTVHELALETAEIYDPGTERFSLTDEITPIDWSVLAELGTPDEFPVSTGTLVALADGGALLVGRTTEWFTEENYGHGLIGHWGRVVRTLRFDVGTGRWTEIDRSLYAWQSGAVQVDEIVAGHVSHNAVAATLADGRVLVAGGERPTCNINGCFDTFVAVTSASLYDPATDTWLALPPMPEPRAGGASAALADGSVLIVGGYTEATNPDESCGWGSTGLASTVRFVPLPAPTTQMPLGGTGTAVIDGTLAPGEWASAARHDANVLVLPGDGRTTTPASLLVMNDGENLYLAVTVKGTGTSVGTAFAFDGDNDGSREDGIGAYFDARKPGAIPLRDTFFHECARDAARVCRVDDTKVGEAYPSPGTVDGGAAGDATRGWSVVEISRPLASGDVGHDVQLVAGDTLEFVWMVLAWSCGDDVLDCTTEAVLPEGGTVLTVRIADTR
jgi:hypothetical protein